MPGSKSKIAPTLAPVDLIPLPLQSPSAVHATTITAAGTLSTNSSTATFTSAGASPAGGSPSTTPQHHPYNIGISSHHPNPAAAPTHSVHPFPSPHPYQYQYQSTAAAAAATVAAPTAATSYYGGYTRNPSTTRSWPVISRTYQQYDYEALYKLTGNGSVTTYQPDPCAIQAAPSTGIEPPYQLQHTGGGGSGGGGLNHHNNNSLEYCSSYDKDSSSDQNLYVSASLARSMQTVDAMTCQSRRHTQTTTTIVPLSGGGGDGGQQTTHGSLASMLRCANAPPPLIFLLVTLLVTTSATAILCGAMMSDHWEHVTWDRVAIDQMTRNKSNLVLEWHLDSRVGAVTYTSESNVTKTAQRRRILIIFVCVCVWYFVPHVKQSTAPMRICSWCR